ncbi:hypothetical protein BpHYR1_049094 [Brachionus plicatilis]|uniref:Uncharacterized protein n=1 Tax=Brachionus plicatilis TaxID=10195 RepID=A0A3M7R835_BRAPC|nr:hypothetical protein BpHYR1_049094 [Brachionus plicatilis]
MNGCVLCISTFVQNFLNDERHMKKLVRLNFCAILQVYVLKRSGKKEEFGHFLGLVKNAHCDKNFKPFQKVDSQESNSGDEN